MWRLEETRLFQAENDQPMVGEPGHMIIVEIKGPVGVDGSASAIGTKDRRQGDRSSSGAVGDGGQAAVKLGRGIVRVERQPELSRQRSGKRHIVWRSGQIDEEDDLLAGAVQPVKHDSQAIEKRRRVER